MFKTKVGKTPYGGDYNPEQWPKEMWREDMRLFKLAGIDIATVNVFSWALNQPDENTYNFDWLDEVMDMLHENGMHVCLGTGTAAHPAWMATRYPDVCIVESDGMKRKFGRRHNSCPNSPTYRLYARRLAGKLAERYKDHPALLLWHVNNEYGLRCYCDNCERAFREWLKGRYGTLEALNAAWYTRFWGHTFYDWSEIVAPSLQSEHLDRANPDQTAFQGISLDYDRFISDCILTCYIEERDAIKAIMPDAIVTTNFQSNGAYKPLDYFKWARYLDVAALDCYPTNDTPMGDIAFRLDLMRGMKQGQPFLLMEQSPSQLNWKPYNALKRPGVMRLWSYQAIARGADSIMFFQLRKSLGAFEKFHGAVIDHSGHEHTRVFAECAQLGRELKALGDGILGAKIEAKAAILFDWDNWWALEHSSGPSVALKYLTEVQKYYDAFYERNVPVDIVSADADLDGYEVLVLPVLYMVKPGMADKLERYTRKGGTVLGTYFSGLVGESDLIVPGGYPGELRSLFGVWVEETDALSPEQTNTIEMREAVGGLAGTYSCGLLCDLTHSEGAEVMAVYGKEFYRGTPVLTRNRFGAGEAWYVASSPDKPFLFGLIGHLCEQKGIRPLLDTPSGVEASRRIGADGTGYLFILNHNEEAAAVNIGPAFKKEALGGSLLSGEVEVPGSGLLILLE